MPATTPRGYPYPLPAEPVAEGAQAIRNLAEGVDAKVGIELIQAITLTGDGAFDFQNIPQIYRHLLLLVTGLSGDANQRDGQLRLNNDSSAVYVYAGLLVIGAGAATNPGGAATTQWRIGLFGPNTAQEQNFSRIEIPDYTLTGVSNRKVYSYQAGGNLGGGAYAEFGGGRYFQAPAAITRIQILNAWNFKAGSRAELYGLK